MGIDEAGRGCVLGDLVIAAFVCDDPDDHDLRDAGATDSKALSPARRVAARTALVELGQAHVVHVTPRQIDAENLNRLEEAAIIELIKSTRPDVVYLDALGHPRTLPALEKRLHDQLPADLKHIDWTIEPKADANYPVVGAASIFAKTARDEALQALVDAFGPLGSGYPGDPRTKEWLVEWSRTGAPWPAFVRTRWATITELAQPVLW
ncbi:MAG: ribonuclease HII [Myxococcota bacterium]